MVKCAIALLRELKSLHVTPDYCNEKCISYESGLRCRKELEKFETSISECPRNLYAVTCCLDDGSNSEVFSLRLHCLAELNKTDNFTNCNGAVELKNDSFKTEHLDCTSELADHSPIPDIKHDFAVSTVSHQEYEQINKNFITGRIYCDFCNYSTMFRSFMKKHVAKHSGDPRCKLFCPLCPYVTFSRTQHNEHLCKTHMETDGRFSCTLCVYRTAYKSNLYRHLLRHKKWNLDILNDTKSNIPDTIVGGFYLKSCPYCEFTTNDSKILKEHLQQHIGKTLLTCEFCKYSTYFKNNLRFHMHENHGVKLDTDMI